MVPNKTCGALTGRAVEEGQDAGKRAREGSDLCLLGGRGPAFSLISQPFLGSISATRTSCKICSC